MISLVRAARRSVKVFFPILFRCSPCFVKLLLFIDSVLKFIIKFLEFFSNASLITSLWICLFALLVSKFGLSLSNLLGIAFKITFVFFVVSKMVFIAGHSFRS